jgi:hypothetical protein
MERVSETGVAGHVQPTTGNGGLRPGSLKPGFVWRNISRIVVRSFWIRW